MNELVIRELLQKKLLPQDLLEQVLKLTADPSISWEEKRPLWHFLHNTGRDKALIEAIRLSLENKTRIPFDLLIELFARANVQPSGSVLESLMKGMKKQRALDEIISSRGWDKWEPRIPATRNELLEQKVQHQKQFKENLVEKFEFLKNQRMTEQAGQVLKRLKGLYPDDPALVQMQKDFDEEWARNILSTHMATLQTEAMERTRTAPSSADEAMMKLFLSEGEKVAFDHREFAYDLAIAFWYVEDYPKALEILTYAPPSLAVDWMRAELLFAARHFLEALEQLNVLEIKFIDDPESTFAVSYLRGQCLFALGQQSSALEILQSIVRVRPNYRSAHALILEWTAGVSWE
ncbi:MAG: tetratricopeptide repeat protein [Bdellovibrionales bacterium]